MADVQIDNGKYLLLAQALIDSEYELISAVKNVGCRSSGLEETALAIKIIIENADVPELVKYKLGDIYWSREETLNTLAEIEEQTGKTVSDPRNSHQYKKFRERVLKRDNHRCRKCGTTDGPLEVHHLELFSVNTELRCEIDNGITLCKSCHKEEHKKRGE